MPRHLSPEWVDDWCAAVEAAAPALVASAGPDPLAVTVAVEAPPGDVAGGCAYHLVVAGGTVRVGAGPAPAEAGPGLTFTQDRATAEAVAQGRLNAQTAFLHGRLRVGGDVRRLVAATAVFRALDDALAGLRAGTSW